MGDLCCSSNQQHSNRSDFLGSHFLFSRTNWPVLTLPLSQEISNHQPTAQRRSIKTKHMSMPSCSTKDENISVLTIVYICA